VRGGRANRDKASCETRVACSKEGRGNAKKKRKKKTGGSVRRMIDRGTKGELGIARFEPTAKPGKELELRSQGYRNRGGVRKGVLW